MMLPLTGWFPGRTIKERRLEVSGATGIMTVIYWKDNWYWIDGNLDGTAGPVLMHRAACIRTRLRQMEYTVDSSGMWTLQDESRRQTITVRTESRLA